MMQWEEKEAYCTGIEKELIYRQGLRRIFLHRRTVLDSLCSVEKTVKQMGKDENDQEKVQNVNIQNS